MSKLEFTENDFMFDGAEFCGVKERLGSDPHVAAETANRKFATWLESQKTVYSNEKGNVFWVTKEVKVYKYKAKLVCIEEVDGK